MSVKLDWKKQYPRWLLFAISTLILLVGFIWVVTTRSDSNTVFIYGLSIYRFSLCILILIITLVFVALTYREFKNPSVTSSFINRLFSHISRRWFLLGIILVGYIALGILLYPSNQLETFSTSYERIKPVIFIVFGFSINILVWVGLNKFPFKIKTFAKYVNNNNRQLSITAIIFIIFIITWIIISLTKLGIQPDLFWKVVGIPFLSFQLYLIIGYLLFFVVTVKYILQPILHKTKIKLTTIDLLVFILLWLIASLTWIYTPQVRSYFAPGPYPPGHGFFPFSDAAAHDIGGYMLTLGLPVNNGMFTDKPAYMFFLGLLHLIFGDDPTRIVTVQTTILALFPAVLYLLGKEIYGRFAGLFIALISIARAVNAINIVTHISTTSVKELMSEMPLALSLSILCLLIIRYLKRPERDIYPISIGGIFGISILIRPHPLLFLPFLTLVFVILHWKQKRILLRQFALFFITLLIVITPISISNIQHGRRPDFLEKIFMVFQRGDIGSVLSEADNSIEENFILVPPTNPSIDPQTITTENSENSQLINKDSEAIIVNKVSRFISHFLHNELTIILSLPSSINFYNQERIISAPYWKEFPIWDGILSTNQWFSILIGLIILAFGLAKFMVNGNYAGLIPLLVQLTINASNSIARSSGGRFIVPVDWIIYIYYVVGIFEMAILFFVGFNKFLKAFFSGLVFRESRPNINSGHESSVQTGRTVRIVAMSSFLLLGLAIAYLYLLIPQKYPQHYNGIQILKKNDAYNLFQGTISNMEETLNDPGIQSIYGKAIYPRFYEANQGEPSSNSALVKQPYARLTFEVLNPNGTISVSIPTYTRGKKLINGSSVLVIGCNSGVNKFDGLFVIIFIKGDNRLLIRKYDQPLLCNK